MANEGIPGSYLYSERICASRTSGPIPQVIHLESQSSLESWTVIQGEIPLRNQFTAFSLYTGKRPSNGGHLWLIRDWKIQEMNELMVFEKLHILPLSRPQSHKP